MGFLLTLLGLGLAGTLLLAASPFILFYTGKSLVNQKLNPFQKQNDQFHQLPHKSKDMLHQFTASSLFATYVNQRQLSDQAMSILFLAKDKPNQLLFSKMLPKDQSLQIFEYLKKNKKIKSQAIDETVLEIRSLLFETIKQDKQNKQAVMYYYFDELYQDIQEINSMKNRVNGGIQIQIQQMIDKTLTLLPYFEEYQLFEMSHKFKTLIQKDIKEALQLFHSIEPTHHSRAEKEAELLIIFKTILTEMNDMEKQLNEQNQDELEKKFRFLKTKFQLNQEQ